MKYLFFFFLLFGEAHSSIAQSNTSKYDLFSVPVERFTDKEIANGAEGQDKEGNTFRIVKTEYVFGFEIKTPQGWKLHGIRYSMYQGAVRNFTTYKYGKKNGEFKAFHNNNKVNFHYFYEDDLIEGKWIQYNEDGSVHEEGNYEKGLKQGKFLKYYSESGRERGPVSNENYYKDNKPTGTWITYYIDGTVYRRNPMKD